MFLKLQKSSAKQKKHAKVAIIFEKQTKVKIVLILHTVFCTKFTVFNFVLIVLNIFKKIFKIFLFFCWHLHISVLLSKRNQGTRVLEQTAHNFPPYHKDETARRSCVVLFCLFRCLIPFICHSECFSDIYLCRNFYAAIDIYSSTAVYSDSRATIYFYLSTMIRFYSSAAIYPDSRICFWVLPCQNLNSLIAAFHK